jgi:plasmid stabilization system protein ParE
MRQARLSPRAESDLDSIHDFIAGDNLDAAARVRATILNTADFLARNPELGRLIRDASPRHAQIRWSVVPRFRNYLIFYQPFGGSIMVIRILHAAQDWTRFFPTG